MVSAPWTAPGIRKQYVFVDQTQTERLYGMEAIIPGATSMASSYPLGISWCLLLQIMSMRF